MSRDALNTGSEFGWIYQLCFTRKCQVSTILLHYHTPTYMSYVLNNKTLGWLGDRFIEKLCELIANLRCFDENSTLHKLSSLT